jgi:hypothetical protein
MMLTVVMQLDRAAVAAGAGLLAWRAVLEYH